MNWFRELFCKHNFKRFAYNSGKKLIYEKCEKCGKLRDTPYDGGFLSEDTPCTD